MATTTDLDMTSGRFLQFYLRMGCEREKQSFKYRYPQQHSFSDQDETGGLPRSEGILVQYSNDGGINWNLLKVKFLVYFCIYIEKIF